MAVAGEGEGQVRRKGVLHARIGKEVLAQAGRAIVADIFGIIAEIAKALGLQERDGSRKCGGETREQRHTGVALRVVGVGCLQRDTPVAEVIDVVAERVHPDLVQILVIDLGAV